MRKPTALVLMILFLVLGLAGGWFGHDYYLESQTQTTEGALDEQVADDSSNGNEDLLPFTHVYRGDGTRNSYTDNPQDPVIILVNSKTELDSLWPRMFNGELPPPKPSTNFENQTLLVAMLAQKDTDGYLGTVQSIKLQDDMLAVRIDEKSPGNACRTNRAPTRPVHVVAIAKTSQEAEVSLAFSHAAPCALPL